MAMYEVTYERNRNGMEIPFNDFAVNRVIDELKNVEIGQIFVSEESVNEIKRLLTLDERYMEDDIRGVRNSVVRILHDVECEESGVDPKTGNAIEGKFNIDKMMKWSNKISGITAVIDDKLWTMGYAV